MSRPIKFRACQKTPSLNHKPGLYEVTGLDFYEGDYGGGEVCLRNKKGEQWTEYIKDVVLEQYTGLKDKNGKEIYEGDIVKVFSTDEYMVSFEGVYRVYFDNNWLSYHMYKVQSSYSSIAEPFEPEMSDNIEVIGNIHEPPKDFRPEHLKRMGVSISKGGGE